MGMTEDPALQALSNLSQRYLDLSLVTANQLLWEGESPWADSVVTCFISQGGNRHPLLLFWSNYY